MKPGDVSPVKTKEKKSGSKDVVRVDRSSSRTTLPATMESWSTYQLPDKLKEYFKADKTRFIYQ